MFNLVKFIQKHVISDSGKRPLCLGLAMKRVRNQDACDLPGLVWVHVVCMDWIQGAAWANVDTKKIEGMQI
jgi:hypothetical protein